MAAAGKPFLSQVVSIPLTAIKVRMNRMPPYRTMIFILALFFFYTIISWLTYVWNRLYERELMVGARKMNWREQIVAMTGNAASKVLHSLMSK